MRHAGLRAHDDELLADDERVAQDLEDLARFRQADAWERRVRALSGRARESRERLLFHRRRLIRNAMLLKPAYTPAFAAAWVDGLIASDRPA